MPHELRETNPDGRLAPGRSASAPEVLKQVEPALSWAHEVESPSLIDINGRHLQAGAGGTGREVFQRQAIAALCRSILGGFALEDDMLDPALGGRVEGIPGDQRAVGRAGLDLVGIDAFAGHQLLGLAVAIDIGPHEAHEPTPSELSIVSLVQVRSPPEPLV